MSFQEARSDLDICNKALALIMQQPLAGSLDDPANHNKLAGRECKRWYKPVVRTLLEKHHWNLATKRVGLVEITNTRSAEWAAAYQRPSDMAFPVMVAPTYGSSSVSYYTGVGYILGMLFGRPVFRYEGSTIYALVGGASLDYVSLNITENDFTQTFENLVVQFLAAKLAVSVTKDKGLADALQNEALNQMNVAIAQNLNVNRQRYGDQVSDSELVRGGLVGDIQSGYLFR